MNINNALLWIVTVCVAPPWIHDHWVCHLCVLLPLPQPFYTLRTKEDGGHFADDKYSNYIEHCSYVPNQQLAIDLSNDG